MSWHVLHWTGVAIELGPAPADSARREAAVRPTGRRFEEFDHPSFRDLYVRRRADGASETSLYLEGVHCASCVWLVERVHLAVPGVAGAELDVGRSLVRLVWDGTRAPLSEVARFLDSRGYRPRPCRGVGAEGLRRAEDRAMLVRIGVAGAIAGNVMMLAVALYSGWFSGMEKTYEQYFRWISLLLTAPSVFGPGRLFFRGAWSSVRSRTLHMDLPIALALGAGFTRGAINTVTARGPIYFDGVAMLIFLLLVGRFLQQRAHRAAADSAELMYSLSPGTARVLEGGLTRDVPTEALLPGMTLEVRPGDTVPADGVVTAGASEVDLSLLTGETRPVDVTPGGQVFAGTLNRTAPLEVRVERAGEATRVGQILREVEAAANRRAPVVMLADRLAGGFVAVVLALAAVTFLLWLRWKPADAVDNAIALLIVTCPCALALATPLAITVGIGRAARSGVLVKGGSVLELLGRPGTLYLDKTGTVTEGRTTLVAWDGPAELRPLVLALERHSAHPIAAGFAEAWAGVVPATAARVTHTAGGGIEGEVDGRRVVVGSPKFAHERAGLGGEAGPGGVGSASEVAQAAVVLAGGPTGAPMGSLACDTAGAATGLTPVWVCVDGRLAARAGFGDRVRADAAASLTRLRGIGWKLRLLSGDHPDVVAAVGRELGFAPGECRGGATPEEKLRVIEAAEARGRVVMVGDGVNDAAAIARASVGVGVHGGAEACLAAADVYLARPGVAGLVELVEGSRRVLGVIRLNVLFSLGYNVAGTVLAVAGVINPLIAAVAMPASSLTVVASSWLSRTFEGKRSGPSDRTGAGGAATVETLAKEERL
ncbi:MAG: cation-translocating P-type ATPase [Candidatus Eisenbacteria bacterium]|nr:cation-translocating P-type ATPase [Candidatus Eisenbacteria bacterium]